MRKRMSDDTNKDNFNRKRILDRIHEGSIPQQNTTKNYDISNAEYPEQQQLTKNVKEDEQKLVQSFKKLMVEQRGKTLKVPPGQQFGLKTLHDYVGNRGTDGQPTSWVINITGKKAKETTIQMRPGKENDWKSGQVHLFFTSQAIKKRPNPSTMPSTNQALYVLYRNFPRQLPRVPERSELAQQLQRHP
ncbi:unnamed protein product [Bathycoccus prasinos]